LFFLEERVQVNESSNLFDTVGQKDDVRKELGEERVRIREERRAVGLQDPATLYRHEPDHPVGCLQYI